MAQPPMAQTQAPGGSHRLREEYLAMTRRKRLYSGILLILFVALMAGGFHVAEERNAGGFLEGLHRIFTFPAALISEAWAHRGEFFGDVARYFPALVSTLNTAAVSTIIGTLGGGILSVMATRGLARWPRAIPVFRRIMDIMRAIPEVVSALVLIFVLGGGPVAAMIAITVHTFGALGKLFSEVNENASLKPVEGLESVGASWAQRIALGVLPQVAPNYMSYALLRFEINIRASAILGFVGAGGIGYELKNAISWGQGKYADTAAIFVLLFLTIVVVDQISSVLRDQLTHGSRKSRMELLA